MRLDQIAFGLVVLLPAGEVALALARRSRARGARGDDGGTLGALWLVILGCVAIGAAGLAVAGARLPGPRTPWLAAAVALLATGLTLRWTAIVTLGRFFTVDVAVHDDHQLVDHGVYRRVRHPSYTGVLLAFAGLALFFGNWLAVAAMTLPLWLVFRARIEREEAVLRRQFGDRYLAYCSRTKRLLPGVW